MELDGCLVAYQGLISAAVCSATCWAMPGTEQSAVAGVQTAHQADTDPLCHHCTAQLLAGCKTTCVRGVRSIARCECLVDHFGVSELRKK